jgi:hypothetical protein
MRWTNAAPAELPAQRYEYRSATPGATVSMSTIIGFDWPFQLANCSGGIDLVPDRFTFSPATLGRASVALKTHALFISVAARPYEGKNNKIAAQMNSFITSPSCDAILTALNLTKRAKAISVGRILRSHLRSENAGE